MKNDLLINPEIKQIGYSLILDLNIQNEYGLSKLLSVNHCHRNHDALLIWLDRILEESDKKLTKQEIINKLFEKIPESMMNH
ncbi:hypothetical protein [Acinetobacter sp. ANC 4862]|uniref:hypothetical protein n=1 Tax=Acinetobacter sp. ANC 4862 TaxID=2529849 RepID=UPI001039427D|nr:hypothetical protein [Acinetobacter sp. ANC 4862]TCH65636.1 hypothetical protein E0409_00055 [Acinetobacter sp. ANC 4862]